MAVTWWKKEGSVITDYNFYTFPTSSCCRRKEVLDSECTTNTHQLIMPLCWNILNKTFLTVFQSETPTKNCRCIKMWKNYFMNSAGPHNVTDSTTDLHLSRVQNRFSRVKSHGRRLWLSQTNRIRTTHAVTMQVHGTPPVATLCNI